MNRIPGLLMTAVQRARWGLPWLIMLAISASVAYATTLAVAGGASASDVPRFIADAPADVSAVPRWSAVTPEALDQFSSDERARDTSGGRRLYVGLNTWIPAEPGVPGHGNVALAHFPCCPS